MLVLNHLHGFGVKRRTASATPFSFTYLTSAQDTANATTYNGAGYQGLSFGTEDSTRIICIGIAGIATSAPNSAISSVTIGGVSATQYASSAGLSGGGVFEFWYAAVPTGTTGDVSVTYGEGQQRSVIHLWAVYATTGAPTDGDWVNAGGANSVSLSTVTVPSGGCGMWHGFVGNTGGITWTNADERYDAAWEASNQAGAADTSTAGTNTITLDGANGSGHNLTGIAWTPA